MFVRYVAWLDYMRCFAAAQLIIVLALCVLYVAYTCVKARVLLPDCTKKRFVGATIAGTIVAAIYRGAYAFWSSLWLKFACRPLLSRSKGGYKYVLV